MQEPTFTLKSKELGGQATSAQIFNGNGCDGENISPNLYWENPPKETKSFAITIYDPAAPTGSGWWHWVIFNIPLSVSELPSNAGDPSLKIAPEGCVQSLNDFGTNGYGGPCPPKGDGPHPYMVTIHALSVDKLDLDEKANPAKVGFTMYPSTIAKASLVFYHKR